MYSCAKGGYLGLQCPGQRRILGKSRHMLRLPAGGLRFPRIAPVQQFQAVQKSLDALELNLVVARTLTADEELRLGRTRSSVSSSRSPLRSSTWRNTARRQRQV